MPAEPRAEMTAPRSRLAHASSTSGRVQTRSTITRTSAVLTAIGAPVSLGRLPNVWSVCRISHYEVIRAEAGIGSGRLASDVAASLGHGVDQPFLAQYGDGAARRGPRDLERVH